MSIPRDLMLIAWINNLEAGGTIYKTKPGKELGSWGKFANREGVREPYCVKLSVLCQAELCQAELY